MCNIYVPYNLYVLVVTMNIKLLHHEDLVLPIYNTFKIVLMRSEQQNNAE